MKKLLLFLLLLFFASLGPGCTEDPPPSLDFREREKVDSIYREEVAKLKPVYDSICASRYDSILTFKVDSLTKVRTDEIERYLKRIRQETAE